MNSTSTATNGTKGKPKKHVHIRLYDIPPIPEFVKANIGDISTNEISGLVQVSGTIVRSSGIRMLEVSKQYECQNPKCKYKFNVYADPEQDNALPFPKTCPKTFRTINPNTGGSTNTTNNEGTERKCNSVHLREIEEARVCVDYQEIKIQDHIEHLTLGSIPRSIVVVLQADLVDRFNPGDDVIVVGTLVRQWKYLQRNARASIEMIIYANNVITLHETDKQRIIGEVRASHFQKFWSEYRRMDQELAARDIIIRSVASQLFGMYFVKLALLLALIGGVDTGVRGNVRRRSNIHMLMVGDPGCGRLFSTSLLW
jgi:DNA helicase MCM9